MTWDTLIETSEPSIRYCMDCDRGVHYCKDESELEHALKQDWCVAMHVEDDENFTHELLGNILPPMHPNGKYKA